MRETLKERMSGIEKERKRKRLKGQRDFKIEKEGEKNRKIKRRECLRERNRISERERRE